MTLIEFPRHQGANDLLGHLPSEGYTSRPLETAQLDLLPNDLNRGLVLGIATTPTGRTELQTSLTVPDEWAEATGHGFAESQARLVGKTFKPSELKTLESMAVSLAQHAPAPEGLHGGYIVSSLSPGQYLAEVAVSKHILTASRQQIREIRMARMFDYTPVTYYDRAKKQGGILLLHTETEEPITPELLAQSDLITRHGANPERLRRLETTLAAMAITRSIAQLLKQKPQESAFEPEELSAAA